MFDRGAIVQAFVKNFILKEKAERCFSQLINAKKRPEFTDRLNHRWDSILRMDRLIQIRSSEDDSKSIQRLLNFRDQDPCYIISNYGLYDDKIFSFQEIFDQIYARGFGSILLNLSGDTFFLDTEQERWPTARFIGRARSVSKMQPTGKTGQLDTIDCQLNTIQGNLCKIYTSSKRGSQRSRSSGFPETNALLDRPDGSRKLADNAVVALMLVARGK